jgi:hypothetical protein
MAPHHIAPPGGRIKAGCGGIAARAIGDADGGERLNPRARRPWLWHNPGRPDRPLEVEMMRTTSRPDPLAETELSAVAGGSVTLEGLHGSFPPGSPAGVFGGPGDDILAGTGGDDRLHGQDGNDSMAGGGGDDLVDGGAGNDVIFWSSHSGSDTIAGGEGQDTLRLVGTGLTLGQLQEALMLWGRGGEPMEATLSEDGKRLVVDGLTGVLTIGGQTIEFSGLEYIELAEPLVVASGHGVAVATGG